MKRPIIKSKRLMMTPVTLEFLQEMIKETGYKEVRKEYTRRYEAAKADPENEYWYMPWAVCLKASRVAIGYMFFTDKPEYCTVGIDYGIQYKYHKHGYGSEACALLSSWACKSKSVYYLETEVTSDNDANERALDKIGYKRNEDNPNHWTYTKVPASSLIYTACIGMSLGLGFGRDIFPEGLFGLNGTTTGLLVFGFAGILIGLFLNSFRDRDIKKAAAERAKMPITANESNALQSAREAEKAEAEKELEEFVESEDIKAYNEMADAEEAAKAAEAADAEKEEEYEVVYDYKPKDEE